MQSFQDRLLSAFLKFDRLSKTRKARRSRQIMNTIQQRRPVSSSSCSLAWLLFIILCFHATRAFLPHNGRLRACFFMTSDNEKCQETLPDKNRVYIQGLHDNLTACLDKWIMTGNPATKQRAYNVLEQIQLQAQEDELVEQAQRLLQRAGLPLPDNSKQRRAQAQERKAWEKSFQQANQGSRSALSSRANEQAKPDILLGQVDPRLEKSVRDKVTLQKQLSIDASASSSSSLPPRPEYDSKVVEQASIKASSWIARAWDAELCSSTIGGLDDVLSQIKRRIWTPLAAPPPLLRELGIHPVRGLLLYGRPGCGKTLVARTLGRILSPLR